MTTKKLNFREWIEKISSGLLSQDYKDGFHDGFRAGIRETRKCIDGFEKIALNTIKEVKK